MIKREFGFYGIAYSRFLCRHEKALNETDSKIIVLYALPHWDSFNNS